MCFYTGDADWSASVCDVTKKVADKPKRCGECRRQIQTGELYIRIFQQEHEECRNCYGYDGPTCDCPKDKDGDCLGCQCKEPDFGESFQTIRCLDCHKFLQAIEQAELDAGCGYDGSQPHLEQMVESINDGGWEEAEKYFVKAKEMFPELYNNGYLGFIKEKIFHDLWVELDEEDFLLTS